ncbi:hypothetical protein CYJ10_21985 [Cupriavidus pauculus]|uniref:Uncharacterized protein n=1 Tax=Cupriavidus pauculus TaxID=82633 RepID=A0A2N5C8K0_9BURK|nr:hypothetical protein CYJ10_21985 [Cupriavidus pauculus]
MIRDRIDWTWSQIKHRKFDEMANDKPGPQQRISDVVFERMGDALRSPSLSRIKTFTDKSIAHAD